jgi:uncharacterized protein YjbI with pentapeptide repeats
MKRIAILIFSVLILGMFILVFPAWSQEERTGWIWTGDDRKWVGKLEDGTLINEKDLEKILQEHMKWHEDLLSEKNVLQERVYETAKNELENHRAFLDGADLRHAHLGKAMLKGAYLSGTDLTFAYLHEADLSETDLRGANLLAAQLVEANLSEANLAEASLKHAELRHAELRFSDLSRADLRGADLRLADLSGASLSFADLREADLRQAYLSGADLSSADLREANLRGTNLRNARLEGVNLKSAIGLPELRDSFRKAGFRDNERLVTYHIKLIQWEKSGLGGFLDRIESLFNLIFFELTCQYGMKHGGPLIILGFLIVYFASFYTFALRSGNQKTGIWLILSKESVSKTAIYERPFKLTTKFPARSLPIGFLNKIRLKIFCWCRIVRIGIYFSLLSAVSIGWREINTSYWITRLQRRDYTLKANGWVRTLAGIQSLLSIYLMLLWALTTFGRPF